MSARTVEKVVWIEAIPERVFDALTSSEQIVKYFPLDKVTSSWTIDGELRMQGTVDGQSFTDHGFIQVLDRPRVFAYSYWSDNHGTENHPEHHVSIGYHLSPEAGGTSLRMRQANLPSKDYEELMNQAWDGLLASLKHYVESQPSAS